jgi:hypothetical protein
MPHADEQIILAKIEEELQIAANARNKIAQKHNMKISATKTKSMAKCGKKLLKVKIVINDTITEQVTNFMWLRNIISKFKTDTTAKIHQ